jgi:hypothetical protein
VLQKYFSTPTHLKLEDLCSKLGLLTKEEIDDLSSLYPTKIRDIVLATVSSGIAMLCESDGVAVLFPRAVDKLADIRGQTATHHDLFVRRDNPNVCVSLVDGAVSTLVFFNLMTYPFMLMINTSWSFPVLSCFQPVTLVGVFLPLMEYRSAVSRIRRIRNPRSWTRDRIKVDMLLTSTDMCLFAVMGSAFKDVKVAGPSPITRIDSAVVVRGRSSIHYGKCHKTPKSRIHFEAEPMQGTLIYVKLLPTLIGQGGLLVQEMALRPFVESH